MLKIQLSQVKKIVFSFFIFCFLNIYIAKSQEVVKIYEGILPLPGNDTFLVVLEIDKEKSGAFTGYLTVPKYAQHRLRLEKFIVSGDSLSFKYNRFGIQFKGRFSAKDIIGTWINKTEFQVTFKEIDILKRRPQMPIPPFSYLSKDVSFRSKDSLIKYAGTLTLPDESGRYPAIILLTGSGEQDRDETIYYHKPFFVLADYLTKKGFAVLRIDDRGVGGSTGGGLPNTTNDYADDALEAISFLKKQRNVNRTSIGLIGHSEGGWIAFIAANKSSEVKYIVSLAAPGVSGKELALKQIHYGLKMREKDTVAINNVMKFWDKSFEVIKNKKDLKEIGALLTSIFKKWLNDYQNSSKSLSLIGFDFSDIGDETAEGNFLKSKVVIYLYPWYKFLLSYNPRNALSTLKIPILALNGDQDHQVDPDDNLKRFELLSAEYRILIDTVRVKNVNHYLQTNINNADNNVYENLETISPVVLETILNWVNDHK
jgi:pimeloyl-ACP methyl ester carboxylesterase